MNRSTATTAPHDYAIGVLERWGVNVVLGDRVMTQAGEERRRFVTRSGQVHHADLAFMCTGIVPNSGFLRNDVFAAVRRAVFFWGGGTCLSVNSVMSVMSVCLFVCLYVCDICLSVCLSASACVTTHFFHAIARRRSMTRAL